MNSTSTACDFPPGTRYFCLDGALYAHTQLPARTIVEEAMKIAARTCIYTNDQVTVEEL